MRLNLPWSESRPRGILKNAHSQVFRLPLFASSPKSTSFQIVILDKRHLAQIYCNTVCAALANSLSQFMLGAVNMVLLSYSIATGDTHAVLCTIGYHFFCVEAILGFSRVNGWSAPMHLRHRKISHAILQVCGIIFIVVGCTLIIKERGISNFDTFHGVIGFAAFVLSFAAALMGPFAFTYSHTANLIKILHISVALPTFILSSVSLIFGLFKPSFKKWAGSTVTYILTSFVIFYTLFIGISVFYRNILRMRSTFKK